jgi:hypothetical protein
MGARSVNVLVDLEGKLIVRTFQTIMVLPLKPEMDFLPFVGLSIGAATLLYFCFTPAARLPEE